jgi:DNA-binding SARP family transcriptional activator
MQISWVDAFALEQVLGEAEKLWKIHRDSEHDPELARRNAEQAVMLMQRAINLNRGVFLESEPETAWLLSPRDRLRSKFIRGITSLAGYLAKKGKFETAVDYCETALETDELAEEVYQHLMTMYTLLDQPVKVLSVYKRCKAVLWDRLNMKPSSRTEAILMASRK